MDFSIDMDSFDVDVDMDLGHLIDMEPIPRLVDPSKPLDWSHPNIQTPTKTVPMLSNTPKLPPADLFEVTNTSPKFNNDKIEKLLKELEKNHPENPEFELDDLGRTRIFKGRFNKSNFNVDTDQLDTQLTDFLNDKENLSEVEPSKVIRSTKRKPLKVTKPQNTTIPVLKPLNLQQNPQNLGPTHQLGPKDLKRICKPNHRALTTNHPSITYRPVVTPSIYLVDSLTGSLNDATQFGTELNASNCEGFPLPEDVNEVVQIPTNEEQRGGKVVNKMAIIKSFHNKYFPAKGHHTPHGPLGPQGRPGFYSKQEYQQYIKSLSTSEGDGVEVVGQSLPSSTPGPAPSGPSGPASVKKTVKFAQDDDLVW